ncbi:hypothetical protein GCK72_004191 [Caenorhabditis remanei]|uniref:Uncharacterized protein n=1 Tax=Caenorhabditis remanei TaxID=31234 RepID=A0A6A5HBR6_CAERE|nr:hypothetical protein GCK72_004191 [Caenorhabditis remanei]KAF1764244.1 hypothetical protein GCK72_004191 [Caenorhabditis remanei]
MWWPEKKTNWYSKPPVVNLDSYILKLSVPHIIDIEGLKTSGILNSTVIHYQAAVLLESVGMMEGEEWIHFQRQWNLLSRFLIQYEDVYLLILLPYQTVTVGCVDEVAEDELLDIDTNWRLEHD